MVGDRACIHPFADGPFGLRRSTNPVQQVSFARDLLGRSSYAPIARAVLVQHDWNTFEKAVPQWEKESPLPRFMFELGRRYSELKRPEDAERCFRLCLKASPDKQIYEAVAASYKTAGNMDKWKETLDAFLKDGEDNGLDRGQVSATIARYFMDQKKDFKAALPYAKGAAGTGAAWGMECLSDCYEGMGEWDKSHDLMRSIVNRYPESVPYWFYWCKRNGRGDLAAAEKLVVERFVDLGDRLDTKDLLHVAAYYLLTDQPQKATDVLAKFVKRSPTESKILILATLYDDLGQTKERDAALQNWPTKSDTPYLRIAKLFAECLAKGEKGELDLDAVDAAIKRIPDNLVADVCYAVSHFLEKRGKSDAATKYLVRAAIGGERRASVSRSVASYEARKRGLNLE
jgi:tetratricopeptide (TPR) repeat protein